jgi:hypothetical protein
MKRQSSKSSSKSSSKKVKIRYKFDSKDNKIMEDKTSPNASFEMIFDKNEPFYRHTHTEE